MINQNYYSVLAKRENNNECMHYISVIDDVMRRCKPKNSIVDIITTMLEKKEIERWQIKPFIYNILIENWNYKRVSFNLATSLKDVDKFIKKISLWNAVDIVLQYEHPEFGVLLINPKDISYKLELEMLKKNELLSVYVGYQGGKEASEKTTEKIINTLVKILKNIKTVVPKEALNGKFMYKKNEKNLALKRTEEIDRANNKNDNLELVPIRMGNLKMSQILSVPVSNELFHNGNVEAWKNIIKSYTAKYKEAKVLIFYEGESISNINSLFKWGKVRYGSVIQFAVLDIEIKDLSKLLKYLKEGASPRFNFFLTSTPDAILNLF